MSAVGDRIKRLRTARGMSQRALAHPRFTAAYVSAIEAGRRSPSSTALRHFAQRLGTTADELASGRPPNLDVVQSARLAEARVALAQGRAGEAAAAVGEVLADPADELMQARALVLRGMLAEYAGRFEDALADHEQARRLSRPHGPIAETEAVVGMARCLRVMGDTRYALHLVEMLRDVMERDGVIDPDAAVRVFTSLVALYYESGLKRQAAEAARRALELEPEVADAERKANMHIAVARLMLDKGEFREAAYQYDRAERLFVGLDLDSDVGRVLLARSFGLWHEGRRDEAESYLRAALDIFKRTGNEVNECRCLNELAAVERHKGHLGEAQLLLRRATELARRGEARELGIAQRETALCHAASGERDAALGMLRAAAGTFEAAGHLHELVRTYRELGDLLSEAAELEQACSAYRAAALALESAA